MKFFNLFSKQKNKTRSFAAAQYSRLTTDWVGSFLSQDSELRGAIKPLRSRARELGRNDDYARAFLRSVENNVIGSGIRLQSNIRDDKGKAINFLNKLIEKEWATWCKMDSCHIAGTLAFQDIERLIIRNVAESGEIFIRFIYENVGNSKIKLALQIIEADLLDETFNGTIGNNFVRMGVEQDEFGRPIAYHFFTSHPGDLQFAQQESQKKRIRVEAKDVIHLYRQERPIQSRGVTWFSSAMLSLRHLAGFVEATIVRKRSEASVMGFIQSPEGELTADGLIENERVQKFEPGAFHYLGPGETVTVPQVSGGQSEFDPFVQSTIRKIATGVGSSYEELSKDYSRSNYSSSRLALISERDHWKTIQDWVIRNFHQKVFEKFLEMGFLQQVFPNLAEYLSNKEKYINAKWMPRGWDWVDPLKDVTADKEALKAGLKSFSDVLSDEGKDFEEQMLQIKKEREFMKAQGIESDVFLEQQQQGNMKNGFKEDQDPEDSKQID